MKEFIVNNFIQLRLVNGKTLIYIAGRKFKQCKFLLINVPFHQIESYKDIKSIDEAAEWLDIRLEGITSSRIPPEIEFWGHCSNLQVWAENGYDSRFLHRNLAFPLLKRLTEEGDNKARKIFKEEIAKRLVGGNLNVFEYLSQEGYLDYLQEEEFFSIIENFGDKTLNLLKQTIIKETKRALSICSRCFEVPILEKIKDFSTEKYTALYLKLSNETSPLIWYYLIDMNFLKLLSNDELISLIGARTEILIKIPNQLIKLVNYTCNTAISFFFKRLEDLSTSDREHIIRDILRSANPELLCYLQYIETYTKSFEIPRNIYLSFILVKNEARTLFEIEELIGKRFRIREMLEGKTGELIITLKSHHVHGLLIAGQETLPKGEETKILDLICNLKKLKNLDLCYLNLVSLTSSIGNLRNLEELNLLGNEITNMPDALLKLKKLRQ